MTDRYGIFGGRKLGKSIRMAEAVKKQLDRGTAAFLARRDGSVERIVDVDLSGPDIYRTVPMRPVEEDAPAAWARRHRKLEFKPDFTLPEQSPELQAIGELVSGKVRELIDRHYEAAFGGITNQVANRAEPMTLERMRKLMKEWARWTPEPEPIDPFFMQPMPMPVDPPPLKIMLDTYPFFVASPRQMLHVSIDVGSGDYPAIHVEGTLRGRAGRAYALYLKKPHDRRRRKRALRILREEEKWLRRLTSVTIDSSGMS